MAMSSRSEGRSRGKQSCYRVSSPLSPTILVLTAVSIVAVHGLNGHRDKTWTGTNDVYWLRDPLSSDIPNERIFCWRYDANTRDDDTCVKSVPGEKAHKREI